LLLGTLVEGLEARVETGYGIHDAHRVDSSFHSFHPSFHPKKPMNRAFQPIGGRMEG
jgi:hypothetical protein